jgi:uncharacterized protein YifE (UPF0438 family)
VEVNEMDREEVLRQFILTRMRIKIFEQKALKRLMEKRSGAYAGNKGEEEMLEKNLPAVKETCLNVQGSMVNFIEYESDSDGDFVKVCTDDHDLGVAAEYAWFHAKYANSTRTRQRFTKMRLNGKVVACDILTIKTEKGETITVYFDISQLMEDLNNIAKGESK